MRPGIRIQIGYRIGRVKTVRGGGKKPYDVMVAWEGEKYPQWLSYYAVERDYEDGRLNVLL